MTTPSEEVFTDEEAAKNFIKSKFRVGMTPDEIEKLRKNIDPDVVMNPNNPWNKK